MCGWSFNKVGQQVQVVVTEPVTSKGHDGLCNPRANTETEWSSSIPAFVSILNIYRFTRD